MCITECLLARTTSSNSSSSFSSSASRSILRVSLSAIFYLRSRFFVIVSFQRIFNGLDNFNTLREIIYDVFLIFYSRSDSKRWSFDYLSRLARFVNSFLKETRPGLTWHFAPANRSNELWELSWRINRVSRIGEKTKKCKIFATFTLPLSRARN